MQPEQNENLINKLKRRSTTLICANENIAKMLKHRSILIIFVIVLLALLLATISRVHSVWMLHKEVKNEAVIRVSVVPPQILNGEEELVLPGNVEAWHQAVIYARTNGYIKHWYTPIGTFVHEGDILAEIETPEVDAQLRQAQADLATAQANYDLAKVTANRWSSLLKSGAVSKQEADEKVSDAKAKEAELASAAANRDHLYELTVFKIVRAPFDGIIYARLVDEGTLVNAGNNPQQPLFRIVQANRLRIYVNVPQIDSPRIVDGIHADVYLSEHPGKIYKATLNHIADNLDQTTRTLLVEFMLDNTDGKLFAGGYAEMHLILPATGYPRVPVNALIFRAAGLQVATVVKDKMPAKARICADTAAPTKKKVKCVEQIWKVVLKNIVVRRDFGTEVEVGSGLDPNDKIIVNPPDSLLDGQQVYITRSSPGN
jgi:RND family efflux transporter MFP subunit